MASGFQGGDLKNMSKNKNDDIKLQHDNDDNNNNIRERKSRQNLL